jgi:hypothetical protein
MFDAHGRPRDRYQGTRKALLTSHCLPLTIYYLLLTTRLTIDLELST